MIFFTADYHLFHKNIIRFCDRPFRTIHEMHKTIVKNHNAIVRPEDTVYFLGDITMLSPSARPKVEAMLQKLNGNFILILGNHDRFKPYTYLEMRFQSVHTSLVIKIQEKNVLLVHDPAWVQPEIVSSNKIDFAVCGHVHACWKSIHKRIPIINCGVDAWDFKPVSFEELYKYYKTLQLEEYYKGR